jgi:hypothetical protein
VVREASPAAASESEPDSVLAGALADVVEGVGDDDDATSARILDAAYEVFCRICPASRSTGGSPPSPRSSTR